MKLTKKAIKEITAKRDQAIGMLSYAETQVRKAEGEGAASGIKAAKDYLAKVNKAIDEYNAQLK